MQRYCQRGQALPGILTGYPFRGNSEHYQRCREDRSKRQPGSQHAAHCAGDHSHQRRPAGAAGVSGKRQQREQSSPAAGKRLCG